jgi:hypothetical protein
MSTKEDKIAAQAAAFNNSGADGVMHHLVGPVELSFLLDREEKMQETKKIIEDLRDESQKLKEDCMYLRREVESLTRIKDITKHP